MNNTQKENEERRNSHYNNPHNFIKEIQSELDKRDIKVKKMHYDDYFGGSWIIELQLNESVYRFVWDNRESWLVLQILGRSKKKPKDWDDVDIYRYDQSPRTKGGRKKQEKIIIQQMLLMLDKLESFP